MQDRRASGNGTVSLQLSMQSFSGSPVVQQAIVVNLGRVSVQGQHRSVTTEGSGLAEEDGP